MERKLSQPDNNEPLWLGVGRIESFGNPDDDIQLVGNPPQMSFSGPVECICGIDDDPTGKLPRLDIVCPKHDGIQVG